MLGKPKIFEVPNSASSENSREIVNSETECSSGYLRTSESDDCNMTFVGGIIAGVGVGIALT